MGSATHRTLPVAAPYRLDLTVAVLRRFSTNVVDVVSTGGAYVRAHDTPGGARIVAVRQVAADLLDVEISDGDDAGRALALVRRTLGVERDATHFARAALQLPWLAGIASRMRGVRAPRYASLWEACVNAIVFQQVSLHAATAILGRAIVALGEPIRAGDVVVRAFPPPAALLGAEDDVLRAAGLSAAKIATLMRVAEALEAGALHEAMLQPLSSVDAAAALCEIKGIGPWTAAVILLRGMSRLDVFPQNDSGVARSLQTLTGTIVDVPGTLARLAPEQGMLYYHLLLARLEQRGEVGACNPSWVM